MGFFDKLKMEVKEATSREGEPSARGEARSGERRPEKSGREPAPKEVKVKKAPKKVKAPEPSISAIKKDDVEEIPAKVEIPKKSKDEESEFEGELAIDVYETDGDFIIQSTIAGVKAGDLDITIENDIVTIRGSREKQVLDEGKKYYYQECYWGAFSRQVILPEEVDGSKAEAVIKDGVLTLRIPKAEKIQKRKISIRQEE